MSSDFLFMKGETKIMFYYTMMHDCIKTDDGILIAIVKCLSIILEIQLSGVNVH